MCLPIAGAAAGSAAAISSTTAIIGTAISAIGTAAGIMQAQQQAQQQAAQFNHQMQLNYRQMDQQYQQAQKQSFFNRQQQVIKHQIDVKAQQASMNSYQNQLFNNNEAANRVFTAEQLKLNEARAKAAFKSQEIYAKSIGSMGKIMATGATGQSVGLLALDTERQAGFALAEQNASVRSATTAAATAMEAGSLEQASANNLAYSRLVAPVQAPLLESDPTGFGKNLKLGIPSYNWN